VAHRSVVLAALETTERTLLWFVSDRRGELDGLIKSSVTQRKRLVSVGTRLGRSGIALLRVREAIAVIGAEGDTHGGDFSSYWPGGKP
jgi:hypothetical protein